MKSLIGGDNGYLNVVLGMIATLIGFALLVLPVFGEVPERWPSVEVSLAIMLAGLGWIGGRDVLGKVLSNQRQLRDAIDRNTRIAAGEADDSASPSPEQQP